MDNLNITMEEYIKLEEEKARRRGIVFNDTSNEAPLSYEPKVSSLNNDEIDFRISFDESDDEDYTIADTAYPNPMDMTYSLSGCYPVFIFSRVYTTYSINEYDGRPKNEELSKELSEIIMIVKLVKLLSSFLVFKKWKKLEKSQKEKEKFKDNHFATTKEITQRIDYSLIQIDDVEYDQDVVNSCVFIMELKQIEVDDQAIQTILLGLPEDIYAAVDSCETAQEIWLRVQQMMKGSNVGIQEKKAKLFNEWERFTSNKGKSIESYYHRFLKLMNDLKRNKHFPKKIASNIKFLNNLQPKWSRHVTIVHQTKDLHTADYTQLYDFLKYNQKEVDELKAERLAKTQDPLALMATSNNPYNFSVLNQDQPSFNQNYMQHPMLNPEDITDPTTTMNMALALMAKAFKLNYSTPTNNNQRISSNPRNRQIAQPGMNMGQDRQMQMVGGNGDNQFRQYTGQNVGNLNGYNDVQNVRNQNGNGNLGASRAEGNAARHNGNQIRCYNCRGVGHFARNYTVRPRRRDAAYLQTQLLIAQKEEQASTSGTQTDKAPVYDSDVSAEVHDYENCYDNEIFNMFTQEEKYTELLEPIPEPHQVPHNDNNVIYKVTSVEQSGKTVEQHPVNVEKTRSLYDSLYHNLEIEVKKVNTVNLKLKETNAELTTELARFKNQEKCFEISQEKYDKLERCYQQSVYQEQCLSKKINALNLSSKNGFGLSKSFYLKQAQKKQQSLYDGKVLLEKHDPPVVHDSEETLQLAQKSRQKMKQLNQEIKPANYTKINHLSGVFVSQTAKSREELDFSNDSKMANVSKPISIPNEEFSNDITLSVARKFLNEVKSTIVTLQRVFKHRMTLETHNWSSSAHQELHKIVKDKIFPIVNQVDDRVQNFEIQFLKEAAKFVGDFKSLAKEGDESLAKHKALELEIKRLLRAVVSQDIMYVVQKASVVDTSNLQIELERKPPMLGEIHALSKPVTSNSVPTPQESKVVKNNKVIASGMFRINHFKTSIEEKHVPNNVRASARTKPITVSQPPVITKKDVNSDSNGLSSTGIDNTKTRRPQPRSNTKNDKVPFTSKSSRSKNKGVEVEEHRKNLLLSKNMKHMLSACNNFKLDYQNVYSKVVCAICKQCLISVNHDECLLNYVYDKNSYGKKQTANVSIKEKQKKRKPKIKKPKKVGIIERLATPKPSKPRYFLRWSPTGRMFDLNGKIIESSNSNMFMVHQLGLFQAHDRKSKASHQFRLEVFGNYSLRK
nr:hypothetical protein [Tanacetum cinerariifolium]